MFVKWPNSRKDLKEEKIGFAEGLWVRHESKESQG
jgi:hypothetical protein